MARRAATPNAVSPQREYSAFARPNVRWSSVARHAIVESLPLTAVELSVSGLGQVPAAGEFTAAAERAPTRLEDELKTMNPPLRDPLLRYASLAGAGLPAGEWHMATAATRRRIHRVAAPSADATSALAELTFTVAIGEGAPAVVFDGDAAGPRGDTKPASGKPRRLILLSY